MSGGFDPSPTTTDQNPDPAAVVAAAERLHRDVTTLLGGLATAEEGARAAHAQVVDREIRRRLASMPVESLKQGTGGRLRVGTVEAAGYTTVWAIRSTDARQLEAIDGVGPKTSRQLIAAAAEIEGAMRRGSWVVIDVEGRPAGHTELLTSLRAWDHASRAVEPLRLQLESLATELGSDLEPARLEVRRFRRLFTRRRRKEAARQAVSRLAGRLGASTTIELAPRITDALVGLEAFSPEPVDVWDDFLARPVAYNGLLADVGGHDPDSDASKGFLPEDVIERIDAIDLDTSLLQATLRGYQAFGAKFALAQVRTILGDDMGLGKTIQALAVFCHLRAMGYAHFLVVCPASVLANWQHETERHTELEPVWRLHGPDRDDHLSDWVREGGVAITTFGTLGRLEVPEIEVAAIVVDEAHYVKNPEAQRTQAVENWLVKPSYTMLMTGTPMENSVAEFRSLVDMVRPDLAAQVNPTAGLAGADAFRQSVAPVYLRRNQADVLYELPAKIETAEWLTLSGAAEANYRLAVHGGNFMAMRRAAFMTERPDDSPKLTRLLEIVDEAMANNRKVIVFSFFRDVLDRVHDALGGRSLGQLTGSVPAAARQELVYRFSAHLEPAVLVSQIEAGGVGMNIQAASVVIIAEPQWKPSTEEQAIARCYRLGQVRPVEVHRLLTEDSVDERMVEVLAQKSALFAQYARVSVLKDSSAAAVDMADDESASSVAEHERAIITTEQHRLGLAI